MSGRSLGEGNGNPLQYSCVGNPIVGGAWPAIVHGVVKETGVSNQTTMTTYTEVSVIRFSEHAYIKT